MLAGPPAPAAIAPAIAADASYGKAFFAEVAGFGARKRRRL
jgi:hypothetical protein